ncbi:site-specific integrase [Limosilactobacillus reuteri]|uniref:hypothetical protein n=1 Tax=Limosilactobacillus reuteri TaxID=1598 RepID=UPI001E6565F9|nr:hypothetical protein [Limosilactobacillus reuteri]MCC4466446.1 hypothetical protein [Limosilactobacillus reuteri]MCC4474222.1 hypothetical protein [Limosilactobacillus reuteri]
MENFKLIVRFTGNKKNKQIVKDQLSEYGFENEFIQKLVSANYDDLSDYYDSIKKFGVLYPEYNEYISVRLKTIEDDKYFVKRFKYDNILKQCLLAEPQKFRSIAKRFSIKADLQTLEEYEEKVKKPIYSFTESQVNQTVKGLSSENRLPTTIRVITKSAITFTEYVKEEMAILKVHNRTIRNQWSNVSLSQINDRNERKFFSRSDLLYIMRDKKTSIKGPNGENRTAQYTGLILLAFKGIATSVNDENNELAQIRLRDIDRENRKITVGWGEYRRDIPFSPEEWKLIDKMIEGHDPDINDYLIQPFSNIKTGNAPIKRWSIIERFKLASKTFFDNTTLAAYKTVRQSGLNYLYIRTLLNNGLSVSNVKAAGLPMELAILCLQQFGDVKQDVSLENKSSLATKVSRLRLLVKQYDESVKAGA